MVRFIVLLYLTLILRSLLDLHINICTCRINALTRASQRYSSLGLTSEWYFFNHAFYFDSYLIFSLASFSFFSTRCRLYILSIFILNELLAIFQSYQSMQLLITINKMQESKLQVSLPSQTIIKSSENLHESSWMKLINQIVRPPRSKFPQSCFGTSWFVMNQTCYKRKDTILKHKGKNIEVSIFEPSQRNMWVILYLHGNSASKLESLTIIRHLPKQVSMACFDFFGCGFNYESDFVSLGVREAEQVETVVSYLELLGYQVILWGRSMGASTALKFGKSSIIVADSAFVSFKSLCKEIAKQKSPCYLPNFLISCLFPCFYYRLRSDIDQLAQFDIEQVDTSQDLKKLPPETLVIFLAGNEDSLVGKHHSEQLFKQFGGDRKYLELFQGTHNSTRPKQVLSKVMGYIADFIQQKDGSYKYQFLRIKSKQSSFTADQSFVFSQHD